jgi:RNA-directed DNA polymerase
MEEAAGVRYIPTGSNAGTARPGSPVVVRYADDRVPRTRLEVAM